METTVTKNIRNLYCKLPYRKTDLLQVMIKVRVSPEKSLADSTFRMVFVTPEISKVSLKQLRPLKDIRH